MSNAESDAPNQQNDLGDTGGPSVAKSNNGTLDSKQERDFVNNELSRVVESITKGKDTNPRCDKPHGGKTGSRRV